MSERPLEGRRTVVLGAAGNAGPAMVAALAAAGATVAGVGRDAGPIEAVEGISSAHAADLLDPAAVRGLAGELGDVDVVVHLVGGWRGDGPIAEVGDDEWAVLEGPLFRTVLNATRAFAPALARSPHGRFLLVSSPAGAGADGHQRRLRHGQGGRGGVDAGARRRVRPGSGGHRKRAGGQGDRDRRHARAKPERRFPGVHLGATPWPGRRCSPAPTPARP